MHRHGFRASAIPSSCSSESPWVRLGQRRWWGGAGGGSGLAQEQGKKDRQRDSADQRLERVLIMVERPLAACADPGEEPREDRPEQSGQREVDEVDDAGRRPAI